MCFFVHVSLSAFFFEVTKIHWQTFQLSINVTACKATKKKTFNLIIFVDSYHRHSTDLCLTLLQRLNVKKRNYSSVLSLSRPLGPLSRKRTMPWDGKNHWYVIEGWHTLFGLLKLLWFIQQLRLRIRSVNPVHLHYANDVDSGCRCITTQHWDNDNSYLQSCGCNYQLLVGMSDLDWRWHSRRAVHQNVGANF